MSLPQINLDNKPFPSELDFSEMRAIIPNWEDFCGHHAVTMKRLLFYFFRESQPELRLIESICDQSRLGFSALL
ncbi:hypothetical protein Syn6312_2721 [Synechococcus sp. PCC 6312]|nr:hypothetical protein Syn6312_2721 [Synechococcus sp. PCC 6312]